MTQPHIDPRARRDRETERNNKLQSPVQIGMPFRPGIEKTGPIRPNDGIIMSYFARGF
jgi:hypothetical protein